MAKRRIIVAFPEEFYNEIKSYKLETENHISQYGKKFKISMPKFIYATMKKDKAISPIYPFDKKKMFNFSRRNFRL